MSKGIPGYQWMVSPDGSVAEWVGDNDHRPDWIDCDDKSDAEVIRLRERLQWQARNNEQLPMAA